MPGKPARQPRDKTPWLQWVAWKPNSIWIYDFTHFTACHRVAITVMDMVSRKWLTTLVMAQKTSLLIEVAFIDALNPGRTETCAAYPPAFHVRPGTFTTSTKESIKTETSH